MYSEQFQEPMYRQMHPPYQGPQYPQQLQVPQAAGSMMPGVSGYASMPSDAGMLPLEQSYVENILRFNRGKVANFYMTYEYNPEWPARVFRGVIEEAGRDHIIISNRELGKYYLLLMVDLDYVEFDEPINYIPAAPGSAPPAPQR